MVNFEARISELEHKNDTLQRNFKKVLQLNQELRTENKKLRKENKQLKKENLKLKSKIQKLERKVEQLSVKSNQPPGSKADFERENSQAPKNKSGRKLGHKGVSRVNPTKIHKEIDYKVNQCEHCKSTRLTKFKTRSKVITDIEFVVVNSKEYYHDMKCQDCKKITKAKSIHGKFQSPFGKTIQTLSAYLSSVCGTTKRPLENLFKDFFGVQISDSTLINSEIRNSKELMNEYNQYLELVKQANFSHKDETTYRIGGRTNYIWVYDSIDYVFYRLANSRSMNVVNQDFGLNCKQISINDCYGGYNRFNNQQICWAHILRECKFHSKKDNATISEKKFYKKLLKLYKEAINFSFKDPPAEKRQLMRAEFENKLCKLMLSINKKTEFLNRMFDRLNSRLSSCFLFVEIKDLPSTNNQAERAIRPFVCHRKLSFGSKSFDGGQAKVIFKTLFENAKRQQKQVIFAIDSLFKTN